MDDTYVFVAQSWTPQKRAHRFPDRRSLFAVPSWEHRVEIPHLLWRPYHNELRERGRGSFAQPMISILHRSNGVVFAVRARGKFLDPWAVRLEILNNGIPIIRLAAKLIVSDETFLPEPRYRWSVEIRSTARYSCRSLQEGGKIGRMRWSGQCLREVHVPWLPDDADLNFRQLNLRMSSMSHFAGESMA